MLSAELRHGEEEGVLNPYPRTQMHAKRGLVGESSGSEVPNKVRVSTPTEEPNNPPPSPTPLIHHNRQDMLTCYFLYKHDIKHSPIKHRMNMRYFYKRLRAAEHTHNENADLSAVSGVAGKPRDSGILSGDQRTPTQSTPEGRKEIQDTHPRRNTTRGLRSHDAISKRKQKRSLRRNQLRRQHRYNSHFLSGAPAQEPRPLAPSLSLRQHLRIATLNVRGTKVAGKKKEIEHYMYTNYIDILIIQETHKSGNTRELGKWYSWYYSGGPDGEFVTEQGE